MYPRLTLRNLCAAFLAACAMLPGIAVQQELQLDHRMNEHIEQVPAGPQGRAMLETTVFQPNGPGPFPLIIINHGKDPGRPSMQPRDRFYFMAAAFVKRGYAVMVPMRQGFANSTGHYREYGCNMTANGYAQAEDIAATLAYARQQKWVDTDRIVVAGQSYGGLATIALGTRDLPGVRGLINFAGGLRDDSDRCAWRSALVSAFSEYGAKSKLPSLWMYGQNDSLFGPELAGRMHAAYEGAGGRGRLVEFAAFKRDSHGMLASRDGEKVWADDTMRFLAQIGMPTKVLHEIPAPPSPARTDFAEVDNVDAVPFLSENGRRAYQEYLTKMTPRAFAVSPSGAWTWAEEGEDPDGRALATCTAKSTEPCRLYSVDDYVVWNGDIDQAEEAAVTASVTPAPKLDAASSAPSTSIGSNKATN
ncbi:dienelactone hydrolase family protein [Massilia yuzhufengensis]|uniref:Dienelactone hydrolase n=1 Tax=Massilia yuzhufengensis TaxID=1164594 RepID=A0A1I1H685_9BURK|nr:prolyl oligopeptidase family serine peptidase [Massilia yuzhufengensis]SFC19331.1 Dienelactone hydrolase [Massilia yuzhufengensis]